EEESMKIFSEPGTVEVRQCKQMNRTTCNRWRHRYQLRVYLEWYREQFTSVERWIAFLFYRRDLMFKEYIAEELYKILKQDLEYEDIVEFLEVPANEDFGDNSFPTFTLTTLFRKSPKDVAEDIKGEFQSELGVKTEVINGFVNFHIDKLKGSSLAVNEIGRDGYGKTQHLHGQKLV